MRREDMLALYDRELRIDAPLPGRGFRYERSDTIVRLIGPSPAVHDNCVLFSRLDAHTADTTIARVIADFRSIGHGFEWKLHEHDTPADLAARLAHHGLTAETPETVVIRDLQDEAPRMRNAGSVEIRRVDEPNRLADLVAVQNDVWREDHAWYGEMLAGELADGAGQIEILIAYDNGLPVATSLVRLHRGTRFASIWGAATLPDFRRRGLYTALVDRHAETARKAGARLLIADANVDSRLVLERVGFQPLIGVQGFVRHCAG
jgi:ribosomal protein S18 acetylase RimI-like enzyme